MVGYLFGKKTGAKSYNFVHNRFIAFVVFFLGYFLNNEILS